MNVCQIQAANALIDGVMLTHLSGMLERCVPRGDLAIRRNMERVVFEVRTEIANICLQMAEKCGGVQAGRKHGWRPSAADCQRRGSRRTQSAAVRREREEEWR